MLTSDDPILQYGPLWGTYEAVELLAFYGGGRVYRARREDAGGVYESAVKLIHISREAEEDEEAAAQSALREIRLLHTMRGEEGVLAYEDHMIIYGDGGPVWAVLRTEPVTPLRAWMDEHPMDADCVRRLGLQVCAALTACARAGIVHHDIREANVFVAGEGRFKLGGFGMAHENCGLGGTAEDIYALGLMLYRLLNDGCNPIPPFDGPKDALTNAVLRACAYDPQEQYEDAAAFRAALMECSDNPVPQANRPDRKDEYSAKPPRQSRSGFLRALNIALIGALALAAAGIFIWRVLPQTGETSPVPAAPRTEMKAVASVLRTAAPTPLPSAYDGAALNAMNAKNGGKLAADGGRSYVARGSAESGGGVLVFDGGELTERRLLSGRNVGSLCITENRLYYADHGAEGRLGYVSLVTGAGAEFADINGVSYVQAFENRIYCVADGGAGGARGIWSVRQNGDDARLILEAEDARNLCVYDGYCYWIEGDGSLRRLSLEDHSEPVTICVGPVDDYAFFGDGLLVSSAGLIRMGLDGSSPEDFAPLRAEMMLIMGGRLFFTDPEAGDALMLLHLGEGEPSIVIYEGEISRLGADAYALFFSDVDAEDGRIKSLFLADPLLAR